MKVYLFNQTVWSIFMLLFTSFCLFTVAVWS